MCGREGLCWSCVDVASVAGCVAQLRGAAMSELVMSRVLKSLLVEDTLAAYITDLVEDAGMIVRENHFAILQ